LPGAFLWAVTVDGASNSTGDTNSITWSHTVGAGSDRLLIVGVSMKDGKAAVNDVVYGGVTLTRIGFKEAKGRKNRVEMWKLLAPEAGTDDITVNLSKKKDVVVGGVSFFNVDQTTPHGAFASATDKSTTPSVDVTSKAGDLVLDVLASQGDVGPVIAGTGQTERWNTFSGKGKKGDAWGAASTESGAPTVTMSWTISKNKEWSIGSVSIRSSAPDVTLLKSVNPAGGQPPGTVLSYSVLFTNGGGNEALNVVITDPIPTSTDFEVGSVSTSLGTTGLSVTVEYSDDGGSSWTYTPSSGAGGAPTGYDGTVTHVRWTFTGDLDSTAPDNAGTIGMSVRIQ